MRVAAFFPGNWWPETAIRPEVARTRGTAGGAAPASRGALVSDPGPGVPGETKRGPSARFRRTRGRCHGADVHTSARSLVNRDPSRGATAETPRPCSLEHTKRRNPDRAADARGATRVRPSARPPARRGHGELRQACGCLGGPAFASPRPMRLGFHRTARPRDPRFEQPQRRDPIHRLLPHLRGLMLHRPLLLVALGLRLPGWGLPLPRPSREGGTRGELTSFRDRPSMAKMKAGGW